MTYDLKKYIQALIREPFSTFGLTPKETEVVMWMAKGLSAAQTAKRLDKSSGTVRKQAFRAGKKIGVKPSLWPLYLIDQIDMATKIEE